MTLLFVRGMLFEQLKFDDCIKWVNFHRHPFNPSTPYTTPLWQFFVLFKQNNIKYNLNIIKKRGQAALIVSPSVRSGGLGYLYCWFF